MEIALFRISLAQKFTSKKQKTIQKSEFHWNSELGNPAPCDDSAQQSFVLLVPPAVQQTSFLYCLYFVIVVID